MPRPDALGTVVTITSLDDADKAMHEMGWLAQELAKIEGTCKQKIEAIKQDFDARKIVVIGDQSFSFSDRILLLEQAVEAWAADNIRPLLPGSKKTRSLLHGEIGLRRKTLVIEIGSDDDGVKYDPQSVLNWIEDSELKPAIKKALTETETTLHLKGAKDAYVARKITVEELAAVGLSVREPVDEPVVNATKLVVTAE